MIRPHQKLALLLPLIWLNACAHSGRKAGDKNTDSPLAAPAVVSGPIVPAPLGETGGSPGRGSTPRLSDLLREAQDPSIEGTDGNDEEVSPKPSNWAVLGVRLEHTDFDYPVTINPKVEEWVEYFTGRGRKHFERYLARSEYFIPYIVPILKKNKIPTDLVYLAMIESGFHNHARSTAAAVGPWQFMPATGKHYGLTVNWWVDERRDIERSTLAAAEYLKVLYEMFKSWELAAAAYNSGEAKIMRAVKMYGTKNFWKLSEPRRRYLRPETKNYVPKIMAAAIVSKNRALFGFPERYNSVPAEDVAEEENESLASLVLDPEDAEKTAKDGEEISSLLDNQEGDDEPAASRVAEEEPDSDRIPIVAPRVSKTGELKAQELVEFEVEGPADLFKIAEASGLPYSDVKSINASILRWCTPPYEKTFKIKLPKTNKDRFLATYNHPSFQRETRFITTKLKRGETLASIARRYKIKETPLKDLNRDVIQEGLYPGVEIVLPMPTGNRSYASLDLYDPPERRRRHHRRNRSGFAHHRSKKKHVSVQLARKKTQRRGATQSKI